MELERYIIVTKISDQVVEKMKNEKIAILAKHVTLEVQNYTEEKDNNILCRRELSDDLGEYTPTFGYQLTFINRTHFILYSNTMALVYQLIIPSLMDHGFEIKLMVKKELYSLGELKCIRTDNLEFRRWAPRSGDISLSKILDDKGILVLDYYTRLGIYDLNLDQHIKYIDTDTFDYTIHRYLSPMILFKHDERLSIFDLESEKVLSFIKISPKLIIREMPADCCYATVLFDKTNRTAKSITYNGNEIILDTYCGTTLYRILKSRANNFTNYVVLYPDSKIKDKCRECILPLLNAHLLVDISKLIFDFICTTTYSYPKWVML